MNIFDFIKLFGGLALFLYGMNFMGGGLEKLSGGVLEKYIKKFTKNIFQSILLGTVVTAIIQSSSATTVLVIGLVNAGLMSLKQSIGVMMGANIGTTVTAQIIRLSSISSDNVFINFLNPDNLAYVFAIVGIILLMLSKNNKKKVIAQICLGFGILFIGLMQMKYSVEPLSNSGQLKSIITFITQYPIFGILGGMIITAIIQSSSASVGILQAVSSTGALTFSSTYPIILGQNLGTAATSAMYSVGTNKNAKRAAIIHLYFNLIGTIIFLLALTLIHKLGLLNDIWNSTLDSGGIANFHTLFNVITTIILIPFASLLEKIAKYTIPDKNKKPEFEELDIRLLNTPQVAINQSYTKVTEMSKLVVENYELSIKLFKEYNEDNIQKIITNEELLDKIDDTLRGYLIKLTNKELIEEESKDITFLLLLIIELERIGDLANNIMLGAKEYKERNVIFSQEAEQELDVIFSAVEEILNMTYVVFNNKNLELAKQIEPLEETIDNIVYKLKEKHIERLKKSMCSIDAGVIFLDLLTNLERISDHCSNIAIHTMDRNSKDRKIHAHEYVKQLHSGKDERFIQYNEQYDRKYLYKI